MLRSALVSAALLLAASPLSFAAPTKPLASGVAQSETLIASGLSTSFFIDVDSSAQQLMVEASAADSSQDVDLLLRYGSPFPDSVNGAPPTADYLFDYAQYYSRSADASEFITISRANTYPVQTGRWYIAVLNFAGTPANVTVKATTSQSAVGNVPITVVFDDTRNNCDVSGWNDATAKSPVGGNSGTTLGQQRKNAINEAARLLSASYKSAVPIRIQGCWKDLGTGNSLTLASAGPTALQLYGPPSLGFDGHNLPRPHTWYGVAGATKMSGTSRCHLYKEHCPTAEVRAQFNTQVDTPNGLGSASFYYGLTANPAPFTQDVDFISVSMHELTHGLGFVGLVEDDPSTNRAGAKLDLGDGTPGYDDIYGANMVDVRPDGSIVPYLKESDADRAAALVGNNRLRWIDTATINHPDNTHASEPAPDNYVQVYTPNPAAPGSTQSHINFTVASQLMLPTASGTIRVPGLSQPMLEAMGWTRADHAPTVPLLTHNTLMFDPKHAGHGIDFARVVDNIYFMVFYTYDAAGEPEWYIAIGPMIDGIFMPGANSFGSSLVRYKFVAGGNPQQQVDPSIQGDVRLDFNGAANHPACNDGRGLPSGDPVAVMTWTLGNDHDVSWCMQPLIGESARGTPDYTGTWYSGSTDSGWGFSFASFDTGTAANRGFFSLIYFPDANGFGRWGYIQTNQLGNDTVYTVKQRRGYCRTCAKPDGEFVDVDAGTMSVKLLGATQENVGTGNKVSLDVTFKDAPGGNFKRTGSSLTLLSVPAGQ